MLLAVGCEHHDHVSPINLGSRFDLSDRNNFFGEMGEDLHAKLGVLHFPASEHDGDLYLVALGKELSDLASLGVEVSGTNLGAILHLLD